MNREATEMDAVLLILAALGLCTASLSEHHEYHFVNDLRTMTEAQHYCRAKYTDLATIADMEDVQILNNMADLNKNVTDAWIGLYDDVDSWRWSLPDTSFHEGETEFEHWCDQEPDNRNGGEYCTQILKGNWADRRCGARIMAVCMDVRGLNATFVFINESMNWDEAQIYCRGHHTDLASVRNLADNQKVTESVPAGQRAWIGLFRDSWKWADESNSTFRYWEGGQPDNYHENEVCVAADFGNSGKWADWRCDERKAFICSGLPKTTKQVIKVRLLRQDSSLDLNDPVVLEQILTQVKLKLKDQEVDEHVKLSWRTQTDGNVFHEEKKRNEF